VSDRSNEGFASRWSRRKAQARQGEGPPAEVTLPKASTVEGVSTAPPVAGEGGALKTVAAERPAPARAPDRGSEPAKAAAGTGPATTPPPTLDDVAELTATSNFSRFVGRDVDPAVKNAAMKKLFADPHFNVMDGLDTYIDDYNKADPLPRSLLRQMVQARVLGLLDDDLEEQPSPASTVTPATLPATAPTCLPPAAGGYPADAAGADPRPPALRHADAPIGPDPSSRPD